MSMHERPIYEWLEFINIHMFNYRTFMKHLWILLIYLRKFHEWGPLQLVTILHFGKLVANSNQFEWIKLIYMFLYDLLNWLLGLFIYLFF